MSLTMHEYDPVYCDGHYCPKDCDGCPHREENREGDDGQGIHLRPGEEHRVQ